MHSPEIPDQKKASTFSTVDLLAPSVRTILATIPCPATNFIAQAWSEWDSHRSFKRIEEFMLEFDTQMRAQKEKFERVKSDLLASPEFVDLIEKTIRRVAVETNEKKRRLLAFAFYNAATAGSSLTPEEKSNLIETLDSLTMEDVERLRQFAHGQPVSLSVFLQSWVNPMAGPDEQAEPAGKLNFEIAKLEARGLIAETAMHGSASWSGDSNHWVNRLRRKTCILLPPGKKLLSLLNGF